MKGELQEAAEVFAAAGDATRMRILKALQARPARVWELVQALQLPQSTISRHLHVLHRAGLVTAQREAQWVEYSVAGDPEGAVRMAVLWALSQALDGDPQALEDSKRLWETMPE
jgi:ArsR family transcriptional regulator